MLTLQRLRQENPSLKATSWDLILNKQMQRKQDMQEERNGLIYIVRAG